MDLLNEEAMMGLLTKLSDEDLKIFLRFTDKIRRRFKMNGNITEVKASGRKKTSDSEKKRKKAVYNKQVRERNKK